MKRFSSCRRLWLATLLIGLFLLVRVADAATLHEHSLAMLKERLVLADPHNFSFVVLGDSRDNDKVFRKVLALAQSLKPLFILHGGDMEQSGCKTDIDHFLSVVHEDAAAMPLFIVPGNHERCFPDKNVDAGKGYFLRTIGPLNFVLDLSPLGIKIVVLDNMDYALSAEQLQYLRRELTPGRSWNFVAMHIPPETGRWKKDHTFTKGAKEMMALLEEKKVAAAFFSHIHLFDEDSLGKTRMFITGGAGAPLYGNFGFGKAAYHVLLVQVKAGKLSVQPLWLEP